MDVPYRVSGHLIKGHGQTAYFHFMRYYSISYNHLFDGLQKCYTGWLSIDYLYIAFSVSKSRSNDWSSYQHYPLNVLWTICLIITKLGTVVDTREWTIHCIHACGPFKCCTREHLCFSFISCLHISWTWDWPSSCLGFCPKSSCWKILSVPISCPRSQCSISSLN